MDSEHRRTRPLSHWFPTIAAKAFGCLHTRLTLAALTLGLTAAVPAVQAQTSPVALTVTADHSPVLPGEAVDFTFTVVNVSDVPLPGRGVTVDWTVPNSVTGATPGAAVSRPYLQVAAHQSYSFHQAYTVDPAAADGSTVDLAASVFLDNASTASTTAAASSAVDLAPTLDVAVEDDATGAAAPNQVITYTVTTTNRGTAAVAAPVLSAVVPGGSAFVSADAGGTLAAGAVQWGLGTLSPGATITRRFAVQAGSAPGVLLAQATAIDQTDGTSQSTSTLTTLVRAADFLALTVTPDHSPVRPGEAVDYTFTVSNPGTAVFSGRGVSVEWNVPNYVTGATAGEIDSETYLQIAPGQSFSFHKSFTVAGTVPDGSVMRLEASAYLIDGDRFGAVTVADAVVDSQPALTVGLTDDAAGEALPGQTVTYTLTATNNGGAAVANTALDAPVPFGTALVAASVDGALVDGRLHWAVGALEPGDVVTRTFSVQVGGGLGGSTVLARAEATDAGNPLNAAAASFATVVPTSPFLGLAVTADHTTARPGDTVQYTFTVSNPGSAAFTGRGVVVEWNVPNFVTGATPGEIDSNSYLSVPAGGTLSFTRSYTVASPADGSVLRLEASAYLIDGSRFGAVTAAQVVVDRARAHPAFFNGEVSVGNGVDYLQLPDGNIFGYYSYLTDSNYIYHFDLGYEYVFDAADGRNGVYLYDFASRSYFYTSPEFPFPYLYDFSLNSVVYYYPDPNNPGRYNTDGYRFFYVFNTRTIIVK